MPTASWSDLRDRREAVGRAGGVRDRSWCFVAVVGLVEVDAEHDRDVRVGRGRRDDDLLRALREVLGGARAVGEEAGRLDHDVDAELAPRQRRRVALGEHLAARAPSTTSAPSRDLHLARVGAEDRVVPEQVRERRRVGQVVDRDPLDCSAPARSALAARNTFRPIRPKPLIPTRTGIASSSCSAKMNDAGPQERRSVARRG